MYFDVIVFYYNCMYTISKGSRKKKFFLVDSPLRGWGEGVRGCPVSKKKNFFECFFCSRLKNQMYFVSDDISKY